MILTCGMKTKRPAGRKHSAKSRVKEASPAYASTLRSEPGADVQKIAQKFGLQQEVVSRMTGFSLRAVAAWAGGKPPSAPVKRALTEMDRLLDALSRLMKPKDVGQWLKHSNAAFDGSTPVQVIERGQSDRIWRLLYHIESGEPG